FCAATARRRSPKAPCSSRPKPPASRRTSAAGWGSATPAPAARRPGRCATFAPARSQTKRTRTFSSASRPPWATWRWSCKRKREDLKAMSNATHPDLTEEQIQALGDELDELRGRVIMDLGERDANYIRNVIKVQRGLEIGGRALLFAGFLPPAWIGGTTALALSKILDNMEIGHNVMHGQYDWMKDPALDSA